MQSMSPAFREAGSLKKRDVWDLGFKRLASNSTTNLAQTKVLLPELVHVLGVHREVARGAYGTEVVDVHASTIGVGYDVPTVEGHLGHVLFLTTHARHLPIVHANVHVPHLYPHLLGDGSPLRRGWLLLIRRIGLRLQNDRGDRLSRSWPWQRNIYTFNHDLLLDLFGQNNLFNGRGAHALHLIKVAFHCRP